MNLFKKNKIKKQYYMQEKEHLLSEDSPFAVQEAYKGLRTNVIFSFQEGKNKKIVVTSAGQGEAKSTTAINLGITFAQNHAKVIVVDCDMRLPTVGLKTGIKQSPGLSNFLVGVNSITDILHHLDNGLDVIPAGDIPPNPTELLGSEKMKQLLDALTKFYDYILLDTPPVCIVADAVILTPLTSGTIIVARQNVATQDSMDETLRKLKMAGTKILGFVFTGVENEKEKAYRNKGAYGYGYDYSHKNVQE